MIDMHNCLVCGWKGLEIEISFPCYSSEICACCGTQYGLDVKKTIDILTVRYEWLEEGAEWFDDEDDVQPRKPKNWNVQVAKAQIDLYLKTESNV